MRGVAAATVPLDPLHVMLQRLQHHREARLVGRCQIGLHFGPAEQRRIDGPALSGPMPHQWSGTVVLIDDPADHAVLVLRGVEVVLRSDEREDMVGIASEHGHEVRVPLIDLGAGGPRRSSSRRTATPLPVNAGAKRQSPRSANRGRSTRDAPHRPVRAAARGFRHRSAAVGCRTVSWQPAPLFCAAAIKTVPDNSRIVIQCFIVSCDSDYCSQKVTILLAGSAKDLVGRHYRKSP